MSMTSLGHDVQPAWDAIAKDHTILDGETSVSRDSDILEKLHAWLDTQPDKLIANVLLLALEDPVTLDPFIQQTVHDRSMIAHILQLQGDDAQTALDYLQLWIDQCSLSDPNRRRVLYLLVKLSTASSLIPEKAKITDVSIPNPEIWNSSGSSDMWLGRWLRSGIQVDVVLKQPKANPDRDQVAILKDFIKEAFVWRQLRHKSIYPLMGLYWDTSARPFAVTAYTRFRTLHHLTRRIPYPRYAITEQERYKPAEERERLFYEIADGLAYLHSQKIVHVDMKPENVFIDESRHACISDFGSGFIGENTTGKLTEMSPATTRFWIPPEYLRPEGLDDDEIEDDTWTRPRPGPTYDVWGFGCICYTVCLGIASIFPQFKRDEIRFRRLVQSQVRPPRPQPDKCHGPPPSDNLWHFVISPCWDLDPLNRPHMETLRRILAREVSRLPGGQPYIFRARTNCSYKAQSPEKLSFQTNDELCVIITSPLRCPSGCDQISLEGIGTECGWKTWHDSKGLEWIARTDNGAIGVVARSQLADPVMFQARANNTLDSSSESLPDSLSYYEEDVIDVIAVDSAYTIWHAIDSKGRAGGQSSQFISGVWSRDFDVIAHTEQQLGGKYQTYSTRHRFVAPAGLLDDAGHGTGFERGQLVKAVQRPNFGTEWMAGQIQGSEVVQIFPVVMMNTWPIGGNEMSPIQAGNALAISPLL